MIPHIVLLADQSAKWTALKALNSFIHKEEWLLEYHNSLIILFKTSSCISSWHQSKLHDHICETPAKRNLFSTRTGITPGLFYFCLDHSYYFSPQNHHVLQKAEHICDLIWFRRNWELKFSIHMPALVLTIMYIMNHTCQLGLYLNSNKPLDLYKSLEMWSIRGLITRYQRFQFCPDIRRHQLSTVLRFHVTHFCPECACPWFFFKIQSNILWASMLQHCRHTTIWHSTIAGTHHQTYHVAKKYLFKWQGWKGSHNIEP